MIAWKGDQPVSWGNSILIIKSRIGFLLPKAWSFRRLWLPKIHTFSNIRNNTKLAASRRPCLQ